MIDRVKFFLTFCLITMQNLVVVYNTVRTQEIPKLGGRWVPAHFWRGLADPRKTRYSSTCVIIPNCVALGQIVWAYVVSLRLHTVPTMDGQRDGGTDGQIGKTISRSACTACWRAIKVDQHLAKLSIRVDCPILLDSLE